MPLSASDIEPFIVWYFLGTEMPYPSSHTNTASGTCSTPAALMVSQNCPSEVDASPMVQKQTSFPLSESPLKASEGELRKVLDANANPKPLAIWPAVGAMSDDTFFLFARSSHSPFSSTK